MIPLYFPKWIEEIARGVFVAIGGYVVAFVVANGFPDGREALLALSAGLGPVIWAAFRGGILNATPFTPPVPPNPVNLTGRD